MSEEIQNTNAPEGGDGPQTLTDPHGNVVPLSDSQKAYFKWKAGGMKPTVRMNASDAQALDKAIKSDDAIKAKEEAARRAGEESWDRLEEQTEQADEAQYPSRQKAGDTGLEVPGETPREHREMVEANLREVAAIGKEAGIATETLQTFVDDVVENAVMDLSGVNIESPQAVISVMSRRYGADEVIRIVSDAQAAVDVMGEKVRTYLRKSGLGNDPNVLLALARWKRGDYRLAPDAANAELKKIQSNKAYAQETPEGRVLRDRARLLYKLADKKPAKQSAAAPKAQATAKANPKRESLERELKAAIAAPEYRKSGRGHAEAVARVEGLYRELYPGNRNEAGEDE